MTRFAPLLLVVLALGLAVPAAFADDSAPPSTTATTTTTTATGHAHPVARLRLDLLRLRLRLARLEYRAACRDKSSDRCTQFTQKLVTRLTVLENTVEQKLTALNCSSDSTDKRCTLLGKIDAKLKDVLSGLAAGS